MEELSNKSRAADNQQETFLSITSQIEETLARLAAQKATRFQQWLTSLKADHAQACSVYCLSRATGRLDGVIEAESDLESLVVCIRTLRGQVEQALQE